MDVTELCVSFIGVAGALGGTLGGAMLSQRARKDEDQRAERERAREREDRAVQARRDLYAQINTAARAYRVAARDAVEAANRGENVDPAHLDTAKEAWAEQYSQAQMALTKDVLEVASDLNRALGAGYSVVRSLPGTPDTDVAYRRAKAWFKGPLSNGVYLLRVTLRHDLGVEDDPHFQHNRAHFLAELNSARVELERQLAAERRQGAVRTARTP
ncbi:hypothetical protein ACFWVC_12075 [Streptomyces sp. NPDC058691]|uniref:hypothetical protein n=1 Tax=Streptomyces sp. NPDC058691 TaxID=3346601 RepID=UPI0036508C1E